MVAWFAVLLFVSVIAVVPTLATATVGVNDVGRRSRRRPSWSATGTVVSTLSCGKYVATRARLRTGTLVSAEYDRTAAVLVRQPKPAAVGDGTVTS